MTRLFVNAVLLSGTLAGCSGEVGTAHPDPLVPISTPSSTTPASPGPQRMLRRLSHEAYDRTVTALLQIPSTWGQSFPADPVLHGFEHAPARQISLLMAEQLRTAAESLAEAVMTQRSNELLGCDLNAGIRCAEQFVPAFGRRAYRRPLTEAETERYLALFRAVAEPDGSRIAFETVIAAFLQSPHFLYRSEIGQPIEGGRYQLDAYETATLLAYTTTGGPPDDALLNAASTGQLDIADGRSAEIDRLSDPASPIWTQFITTWLDLDRLAVVPKDLTTYPEFTPEIRDDMRLETERFIAEVMTNGPQTLPALLTEPYSFPNATLAAYYGLPAPDENGRVTSDHVTMRGLLTQGSVLATHARSNESSPIHRGLLIRERLFCQHLPPPPPGVNAEPPPLDSTQTVRQRFAAHSTIEPCRGCHRLIDPIGFAFETFDGIGRHRTEEHGHPIDDSGEVVDTPASDGAFEGVTGLAEHLAWSQDVQNCFVRQWLRYLLGEDDPELAPLLSDLQTSFQEADMRLPSLMRATLEHPEFFRRVPAAVSQESSDQTPSTYFAPESGVEVEIRPDSDWGTGYCKQILIRNPSDTPKTWAVTFDVDGTLGNVWNAEPSEQEGRVTFRGVRWNAQLAPSHEITFGFCAHR